jgi:hypothetical protein
MPEWAGVLVGVAAGTVVTCVGVYYNEWLRDRRTRRKQGAQLVARVRVLLEDADPASFSLGTMRARNQAHGRELWRRWYELREPFSEFGFLGSPDERKLSKRAGTEVAFTIQALRNSVDDDLDDDQRAEMRRTAKQQRGYARESLDRLEDALNHSWWRRTGRER